VNSASRFTITSSTTNNVIVVVPWTPSSVSAFSYSESSGVLAGYHLSQLDSNNTAPLEIRPLRMTVHLTNITQNLNIGGDVHVLSSDQPLLSSVSFPATSTTTGAVAMTSAVNLSSLVYNHPKAQPISGVHLTKTHKFVCPPSSFVAYNSYTAWVPLVSNSSFVPFGFPASDWWNWFNSNNGSSTGTSGVTPYPAAAGTDLFYAGPLGDIPPVPMLMFSIPVTAQINTYQFDVFRQDGVRYPSNTLAASLADHAPVPPSAFNELWQKASQSVSDSPPGVLATGKSGGAFVSNGRIVLSR